MSQNTLFGPETKIQDEYHPVFLSNLKIPFKINRTLRIGVWGGGEWTSSGH